MVTDYLGPGPGKLGRNIVLSYRNSEVVSQQSLLIQLPLFLD